MKNLGADNPKVDEAMREHLKMETEEKLNSRAAMQIQQAGVISIAPLPDEVKARFQEKLDPATTRTNDMTARFA